MLHLLQIIQVISRPRARTFLLPKAILTDEKKAVAQKHVTFYPTYGYKQDDHWIIPLRIWVRENFDILRRLAARGARKMIRKRAGLAYLNETQKCLFMSRSEAFGFPTGSVHMKNVRTNPFESESYQDLWKLIVDGSQQTTVDQKTQQISMLMTHFPTRRFILIGDSGEKDPEVFRAIKGQFSEQVQEIQIRDIVNDQKNNPSRLDKMRIISMRHAV